MSYLKKFPYFFILSFLLMQCDQEADKVRMNGDWYISQLEDGNRGYDFTSKTTPLKWTITTDKVKLARISPKGTESSHEYDLDEDMKFTMKLDGGKEFIATVEFFDDEKHILFEKLEGSNPLLDELQSKKAGVTEGEDEEAEKDTSALKWIKISRY